MAEPDDGWPSGCSSQAISALVVEDTWHVGKALQKMLEDLSVEVAGPAATVPEAEGLIAKTPTVAFVDVKLRDGELAYGFLDALHNCGIRVIVTSGFAVLHERVEKIIRPTEPLHPSQGARDLAATSI
jgi:ActR/RegA family two-component response regulator